MTKLNWKKAQKIKQPNHKEPDFQKLDLPIPTSSEESEYARYLKSIQKVSALQNNKKKKKNDLILKCSRCEKTFEGQNRRQKRKIHMASTHVPPIQTRTWHQK